MDEVQIHIVSLQVHQRIFKGLHRLLITIFAESGPLRRGSLPLEEWQLHSEHPLLLSRCRSRRQYR